jgi:hypothetical protein
MNRRMMDFMVLVVAAMVTAACETAGAGGALYVQSGPPPVRYEVVTVSPGPEFVWISGYWAWSGAQYAWVSGRWERPPTGYTAWVSPRYERREGGWYYRPGHWGGGHGRGRGRGHDRHD